MNEISIYGRRLAHLMRVRDEISQYELADKSGVPQPTIQRILSGETQNPKAETLRKLAAALYATESLEPHPGHEGNGEPGPQLGRILAVPVVANAQLGDDGYWAELEHPAGFGDGVIDFPVKDESAYAVRCRGDSMRPRIKDGEFVIVEPGREPIPGDEVLVKHKDGRVMVKELLYIRDGYIKLLSINEAFPPHAFSMADVDCCHPVVAIVKAAQWRHL